MRRLAGILLIVGMQSAIAQTVTLKGVVRDQAGERLPSAYVFIYPD